MVFIGSKLDTPVPRYRFWDHIYFDEVSGLLYGLKTLLLIVYVVGANA